MKTPPFVVLLLALVGCWDNDEAVGPGRRAPYGKNLLYGPSDKTFDLTCPPTSITQGQTKPVVFGIARYTRGRYDVTLEFSNLPKGVTIDPASPVIGHGEAETTVDLVVADDCALGDFTIKAIGHPTEGVDSSSEFHVTVSKDPDVDRRDSDEAVSLLEPLNTPPSRSSRRPRP